MKIILSLTATATTLIAVMLFLHAKRLQEANLEVRSSLAAMEEAMALKLSAAETERDKARAGLDKAQSELAKARGMISRLNSQSDAAARAAQRLQAERDKLQRGLSDLEQRNDEDKAKEEENENEFQGWAVAELSLVKDWTLGFIAFAGKSDGRLPKSLNDILQYVDADSRQSNVLANYELVETGYEVIDQIEQPRNTPVIRSIGPFEDGAGGEHWFYGYADGHAEMKDQPITAKP